MTLRRLACPLLVCCLAVAGSPAAQAQPDPATSISLGSVVIDTSRPLPPLPKHLTVGSEDLASEAARDNEYVLVKFPGPVTARQRAALEAASERVYAYLPHFAFLVKMAPGLPTQAAEGTLGATWIGAYQPFYKISPALAAVTQRPEVKADELRVVLVRAYPDADLGALRRRLAALGMTRIVGAGDASRFPRLRLLLTTAEIARFRDLLAQLREVFWIDLEGRKVLLNDTTTWVCQSGVDGGGATPVFDHGIFGEGQVVGILDTGIDADMCYFRDLGAGLPPVNPCDGGTVTDPGQRKVVAVDFLWTNECAGGISGTEWDTHDHGSHVAGTVAGDNFANLLLHDPGDGMAPGAKLVIQDGGFQTDNCADLPGLGCPVVDLVPIFQQAYDQGARIHTNSWGDRENFTPLNVYSAGSEDADTVTWTHKDLLLVFAAGNSGPGTGTVLSPSTAKNVVGVGATQRGTSAESLASFSSCGPTDDGRIKPEVTAPGVSIVSANNDVNVGSNNCDTRTMSGTSMASPAVAGLAALVRQYYADGYYPTGTPQPADAFTPSAALLKASLVSSAREMTGASPIPANCQGWGRVLLDDVLAFPGDARALWVRDDPTGFPLGSSGETRDFFFTVHSSAEPFKATLAWTDFPSTPAANPHLNNDLDLTVTGPGGTFLGNVFASGGSVTGGAADRLNTLEQVLVKNPPAGTYTVTVASFNVPDGPQDFALVVTGDVTEEPPCSSTCGNGVIECSEVCDGPDLGGATCSDLGCTGGVLACNGTCDGFDAAACTGCPACDDDGVCEAGEDCFSCPNDCPSGSTPGAVCGNGVCEAGDGENCVSCAADCNGQQGGKPANRFCCGDGGGDNPLPCSDPQCSTGGFSCTDVAQPPGSFCCGLFGCEPGEGCSLCALDCATGAEVCDDGADNDCDGAVDCADADCLGDPACDTGGCGLAGEACTNDADCCSVKCRGPAGSQTCR